MPRPARSTPDQRAILADLRANVTRAELALRAAKEARRELRDRARRACEACRSARGSVKGQAPHVRRARAVRDEASLERADAYARIFGARRKRSTSKERRDEEVERVERDVEATDPALLPYWRQVRAGLVKSWRAERAKGGKRSLWEAFQEHVQEDESHVALAIVEAGQREADRLIAEREREVASAKKEADAFSGSDDIGEDDFLAWLEKNPASSLVAMGNAVEVQLTTGRVVRFPPGTLLAYAKGKRCLRLVYGAKRTRASAPDAARAEYEKTHWGRSGPWGMASGDLPSPVGKGHAIASVVYTTKKGTDRELVFYEHDFEAPLPLLRGRQIAGGGYRVTEAGIVG